MDLRTMRCVEQKTSTAHRESHVDLDAVTDAVRLFYGIAERLHDGDLFGSVERLRWHYDSGRPNRGSEKGGSSRKGLFLKPREPWTNHSVPARVQLGDSGTCRRIKIDFPVNEKLGLASDSEGQVALIERAGAITQEILLAELGKYAVRLSDADAATALGLPAKTDAENADDAQDDDGSVESILADPEWMDLIVHDWVDEAPESRKGQAELELSICEALSFQAGIAACGRIIGGLLSQGYIERSGSTYRLSAAYLGRINPACDDEDDDVGDAQDVAVVAEGQAPVLSPADIRNRAQAEAERLLEMSWRQHEAYEFRKATWPRLQALRGEEAADGKRLAEIELQIESLRHEVELRIESLRQESEALQDGCSRRHTVIACLEEKMEAANQVANDPEYVTANEVVRQMMSMIGRK